MNDRLEKTASSLAIVEKKPQKLGGCVGIFFQLFDWNRRFAKKQLFSKKLLPPVRLKQASKKFGGDENQPKLRLIADENSGGFPITRKKTGISNADPEEQKHEMRAPGLVARLMGLESMPPLPTEKSEKVFISCKGNDDKELKIEDKTCRYTKEEVNVEKGGSKNELRPQKLQKTGMCERRPVARFGAEALQFKNVLSRSRKQHPKLASPLKSPRNVSGKNTPRLIGAATRILEPGLAKSRSKRALAYSNTSHNSRIVGTVLGKTSDLLPNEVEGCNHFVTQQPKGQSSCTTCGNLLDKFDSGRVDERPMVFSSRFSCNVEQPACRRLESRQGMPTENVQTFGKFSSLRNPSGETRWHLGRQPCKRQHDMRARNRVPPRSRYNIINETKNFVFPNRSSSGRTNSGLSTRADAVEFGYTKNESILPYRKRGLINITRECGNPSSFNKQAYGGASVLIRKEMERSVQSINHQSRARFDRPQDRTTVGSRKVDTDISFTVNSPARQRTEIHKGVRLKTYSSQESSLQKSALNESDENARFKKLLPLSGDELGALLEQKLLELNLQGEDETGSTPQKTTAMILQELIYALTSERPFQQDNSAATSSGKNDTMSNSKTLANSKAKSRTAKFLVDCPPDSEHLSPGSVLEASFSNESCLSSRVDDSSGYKLLTETLDCSYDDPLFLGQGTDILDSTTRGKIAKSSREYIIEIHNNISGILCCIELAYCGLKESMLNRAKKVLLNAELVFGNATLPRSVSRQGFSVKSLLLDQFETLASVLQMNLDCSVNIEDGKEVNILRRFTFDSMVEYLHSRFTQYAISGGFKVPMKMPFCVNTEMLIIDIVGEVRRWGESSCLIYDELIEKEMSNSLGQWTDFNMDKLKIGVQIGIQIFEILVDEVVVELWNSGLFSSSPTQGLN